MGGGGGQKSTTNEVKEVKLPAWVEQAGQQNYGVAKDIATQPYNPYPGETVAPLDPLYYQARQGIGSLADMMGSYGASGEAMQGILNSNPATINAARVRAGELGNTPLDRYMNPYTENVIGRTVGNMERSGTLAQNELAAQAAKANVFGGSRQAMQAGIQGAETTRGIGDYAGKARAENYDQAVKQAQYDISNRLTADTTSGGWSMDAAKSNVANTLQSQQNKIAAAKGQVEAADQYQSARMNEIATALSLGQIGQEQAQREMDKLKADWEGPRANAIENLNIRLAALGLTPYGHTETGTSTTKSSGGGGGLGQALGIGGQLLGMLGGLSDRATKTDIEEVGEHPTLPVALYAYRYKSDPKSYPKTVGPMADEVAKVRPDLVRKVGKRRVVDLSALVI
jgi:hypothetical protein